MCRDFPHGPVVKTSPCNAGDVGLIPGWGAKILHAPGPKKKKKKKTKPKKPHPKTTKKDTVVFKWLKQESHQKPLNNKLLTPSTKYCVGGYEGTWRGTTPTAADLGWDEDVGKSRCPCPGVNTQGSSEWRGGGPRVRVVRMLQHRWRDTRDSEFPSVGTRETKWDLKRKAMHFSRFAANGYFTV